MPTSPVKLLFVQGDVDREQPARVRDAWVTRWQRAIVDGASEDGAGIALEATGRALLTKPLWDVAEEPQERAYGRLLKEVQARTARREGVALPDGTPYAHPSSEQLLEIRRLAQWLSDGQLRSRLREEFCALARAFRPDGVVAHGIGALIVYDTLLLEAPDLIEDAICVSLGTPLAHPLVRNAFGGGLPAVRVRHWFNLFNPADPMLTDPIRVRFPGFSEVRCEHDLAHEPLGYLSHAGARPVWRCLGDRSETDRLERLRAFHQRATKTPAKRALLVGIDRYRDARIGDLDGCRNDTYLMSAALQECGFEPEQIRLLHNERATRSAILERLAWLLEDCEAGDMRVLAFSGHGHQLAEYDSKGEPDSLNECLAPHDYAFSEATAIVDRQLCELYADLPEKAYFLMVLDCCHSGGMERDVAATVRGLSSPDDIAHRELRWNAFDGMWVPRELPRINQALGGSGPRPHRSRYLPDEPGDQEAYFGASGSKRRLGRASWMRELPQQQYDQVRASIRAAASRAPEIEPPRGAHLPMIYMACREDQVAREYAHGAVKHGAFTYAMVQSLRELSTLGLPLTFNDLLYYTTVKLVRMGFEQSPSFLGPAVKRGARVPIEPRHTRDDNLPPAASAVVGEPMSPARQQAIITTVMALWDTGAIPPELRATIQHSPIAWTRALLGVGIDQLRLERVQPGQSAHSASRAFARYLDELCAYRGVAGRPGHTRAADRRAPLERVLRKPDATLRDLVETLDEVYQFVPD